MPDEASQTSHAEATVSSKEPREPWPWIVGCLLAFMIATSLTFYAIAASNPDPPVVPDDKPGLEAP